MDLQRAGQSADNFQADVEFALLDLAEIGPAHARFVGKLVLRQALLAANSSQVGGKGLPQVHASAWKCNAASHLDILNNRAACGMILRPTLPGFAFPVRPTPPRRSSSLSGVVEKCPRKRARRAATIIENFGD